MGPKDLGTPAHFISSPRSIPRRKKCPRTNKRNPNCQDILPRTTLSSTDQNHGREKRHVARGNSQGNPQPPNPHRFIKAPLNTHSVYRSDPCHPIKVLMTVHLMRRNARNLPWAGEESMAPIGEQDLTGPDIGPRTSKSSSPPEEPGNRILRGYCGAK